MSEPQQHERCDWCHFMGIGEVINCCELHRRYSWHVQHVYLEVCASYLLHDITCDRQQARV